MLYEISLYGYIYAYIYSTVMLTNNSVVLIPTNVNPTRDSGVKKPKTTLCVSNQKI